MSHFYGTLQGNRGEVTRCGAKGSGMETYTASWSGAVRVYAYYNEELDQDWVRVELTKWQSMGDSQLLYHGPIGEYRSQTGEHDLMEDMKEAIALVNRDGQPDDIGFPQPMQYAREAAQAVRKAINILAT